MTRFRAVLFDLDGTFLDTAPDMANALNMLRTEEGCAALPFEQIRPHVSHGSAALVRLGFGSDDPAAFERRRHRFLQIYRNHLASGTRMFPGCPEVIAKLAERSILWGIVTNKPGWLTDPLMEALGLASMAGCIVSGDTVGERKPHPLPLQHAAATLGIPTVDCIYIGDAQRDVIAGRAAGMYTMIARWGYIDAAEQLETWNADAIIDAPREILAHVALMDADARRRACTP
jgi:phosphoglycolate phosphatase